MANDFSGDSNCVALWSFDTGALTTDSIGGNTLANNNTVEENTSDYKEGGCSADFEAGNAEYFDIADTDLDANFPFKDGDATKQLSVCFWVQHETLTDWQIYLSKWVTAGELSFIVANQASGKLLFYSSSNGTAIDLKAHGTAMATGKWYHVGVVHDGVNKTIRVRIWDDDAGAMLGADLDTTFASTTHVDESPLEIGGRNPGTTNHYDGELDEMVVFKDLLTDDEIDDIRRGIYGKGTNDFSGDANCVALYNFESGALTTDSKGGNTLTDNNTCGVDGADYKQGDQSVDFDRAANEFLSIPNADLDAGFPFKSGDTTKTGTFLNWVKFESVAGNDAQSIFGMLEANKYSFALQKNGNDDLFHLYNGYNGGASLEDAAHDTILVAGRWYFVAVTLNGVSKAYMVDVWDDTAGARHGTKLSGSFSNVTNVEDSVFYIGNSVGGANSVDGKMDESVVFKTILGGDVTTGSIGEIRVGTYGAAAGWAHKFCGVTSPGKVDGVSNANIAKVMGVAA